MSLFQSTSTSITTSPPASLFYVFSLVSCVSSHTFATPTEVTAVTKIVKDNSFYDIVMSGLLQRDDMDYIDGGQKNTRVKKSRELLMEVARLPLDRLTTLVVYAFRHLLLNKPVGKDPPIKTIDAAKNFADVIKRAIDRAARRRKAYYGY